MCSSDLEAVATPTPAPIEALRQNCLERGRRDRISPMVRYQALSQTTCVADDSPEMARLDVSLQRGMTDGLGSIASASAGRAADGRYRRHSGNRLNAVDGSP